MSIPPRLSFPGTRRARSPQETLTQVAPFLKQAGITRTAVVSGLDICPVPVVMVSRPLSASLSVTQGKGLTLDAAKVSGIMEGIEHYHAETIEGVLRLATERELEPACVCAERLVGRSLQYSRHVRILWQAGLGMMSRRQVWVPFDLVHLDLRLDGPASNALFVPSSNGLASGNTLEEALVHALCEVIERHAAAEFYDMPVPEQEQRRLLIRALTDPDCRALVESLRNVNLDVTIWDLTTEIGVPCFLCEMLGDDDPFRSIGMARGFGCHTDSGVALSRAICEAAQSRLTVISGVRDDVLALAVETFTRKAEATRQQWRLRSAVPAQRLFRAIPSWQFSNFAEERDWLVRRLVEYGYAEPVFVDLTKIGWPISVVRVIAPGLRFEPIESEQARFTVGIRGRVQ